MSPSRPSAALFTALTRAAGGREPDTLGRAQLIVIGALKKHGGVVAASDEGRAQAVFADPARALACAVALLRRLEEYNRACEDPLRKVGLRQAVWRGPLSVGDDGVGGEAAALLPRLLDVTPPGRILATRAACERSLGASGCEFLPLGWEYFEGQRAPVDVFEVVPAPGAAAGGPHGR